MASIQYTQGEMKIQYPNYADCLKLDKVIEQLVIDIAFHTKNFDTANVNARKIRLDDLRKEFNSRNCDAVVQNQKAGILGMAIEKYSEVDQQRIESDVANKVKMRIYVGAGVLLATLAIVVVIMKNDR